MAEHDWKQLLDDPEIESVIRKVYRGHAYRKWAHSPTDYDDLESWLWDKAVDIALWFDAPRDRWYGTLYVTLCREVDHYARNAQRNEIHTRARRFDAQLGEPGHDRSLLNNNRLTGHDPLSTILLIERIEERVADRANRQSVKDGFCAEPMCRRLAATAGRCTTHYSTWRRQWLLTNPCSVADCPNVEHTAGLCQPHYREAVEADDSSPRCSLPDCDRTATRRGMCDTHYRRARREGIALPAPKITAATGTCSTHSCSKPAQVKGMCRSHYGKQHHERQRGDHQ